MNLLAKQSSPDQLGAVLQQGICLLQQSEIPNARHEAAWLLGEVLNCPGHQLFMDYENSVSSAKKEVFFSGIQRRVHREPLAYIMGKQDFCDWTLKVNSGVLIPRPETEVLVEQVKKTLQGLRDSLVRVLDLGTGSGNIAIALAGANSNVRVDGVDISAPALNVARQNIEDCHLTNQVQVFQGDLFQPLKPNVQYDVIVSNAPYVPTKDLAKLQPEVRDFEPWVALDGGPQGMDVLYRIVEMAPQFLKEQGVLFLELGEEQHEAILSRCEGTGIWSRVDILKDHRGVKRILRAQKTGWDV